MARLLSALLALALASPARARPRAAAARPGAAPLLELAAAHLSSPILLVPVGSGVPLTPLAATIEPAAQALAEAPAAAARAEAAAPPAAPAAAAHPYIGESARSPAPEAPRRRRAKPRGGLLPGLAKAFGLNRVAAAFDGARGLGFLPDPRRVPGADPLPAPASGGLSWRRSFAAAPLPMAEAAPALDPAGIEAWLREHVRSRPAEFGVAPDALRTLLVRRQEGREGLADAFSAVFQQTQDGVPVEGSYLTFTVQVFEGRPRLAASEARLFPGLSVDAAGGLGEDELAGRAAARLGVPASGLADLGPALMQVGGRWRRLRLFGSERRGLVAAVDASDGASFLWDARIPIGAAARGVAGRGVLFDPAATGDALERLPLGHIEVKDAAGRVHYADASGEFTVPGEGSSPVRLTVRLSGRYAAVVDDQKRDLSVTVEAVPGERIAVLFNPAGNQENATAQVNAYYHVTRTHEFLRENAVSHEAIDRPIRSNTNLDDECNAFFTPWNPSLNFFRASEKCLNTAYDTVIMHEYGHWWHMTAVGRRALAFLSRNGMSEGWGDILAMFMTGQPVLGKDFFKDGSRPHIRTGENDYQWREGDEVHVEGQAWMGFAWKLRKRLAAKLGPERGAALAAALVLPVVFAMPSTVPAAIEAVLARATGKDGTVEHLEDIRAAARAHGIQLRGGRAQATGWPTRLADGIARTALRWAGALASAFR